MKRSRPLARTTRLARRAPTDCTDCGCALAVHDAGWCYGCSRATQCNHRPAPARARIRPRNPQRRAAERERAYGPEARRAWVASLPCSVPMCPRTPSENAHAVTGGTGRKADAATILPLCATHHRALHTIGQRTFQQLHHVDLARAAADTEARWLRHQGVAA